MDAAPTPQVTPTSVPTAASKHEDLKADLAALPQPEQKHLRARGGSQRRATLGVWFVFVAVATTVWVGFRPGGGPSASWLFFLLPPILLAAFGLFYRRFQAINREMTAAVAMLGRGQIEAAAVQFDRLARKASGYPSGHATAVYNLGVAQLRLGRIHEALSCFGVAVRSRYLNMGNPIAADAGRFAISTCHSLLGDVEAARLWLEEGRRTRRLADLPLDAEAEATLLCRQKRYGEAVEALKPRWRELENVLPAQSMHDLRVLLAFAQVRAGSSSGAREMIPGLDEYRAVDHAYRGAHWPDFQAYLAEIGLAG